MRSKESLRDHTITHLDLGVAHSDLIPEYPLELQLLDAIGKVWAQGACAARIGNGLWGAENARAVLYLGT